MANHFETLGIAPAFILDDSSLRRAYIDAQAREHPDRQSDPKARLQAVQRSADINLAWRVVSDPLTRAEYLLSLRDVRVGGETDSVKPSQAALIESLEWREELAESDSPDTLLPRIETAIADAARAFTAHYEAGDDPQAAQAAIRWRFMRKLGQEAQARAAAKLPEG